MISCNISNILAANSDESKIEFNEDMLKHYIHRDLGDIIDFTKIVDITEWIISRDETYIDILVPDHKVEDLFRVCMKTTVRRKRSDTTYIEEGTIYFHSGKDRSRAGCSYKLYNKSIECEYRGKVIDVPPGYTIIRLEAKNGRRKTRSSVKSAADIIKKQLATWDEVFIIEMSDIKDIWVSSKSRNGDMESSVLSDIRGYRTYTNYETKYDVKLKFNSSKDETQNAYTKNLSNKATFFDTGDIRYQTKLIIDLLKDIGMDKKKLTKKELYKNVESIFKTKKTCKTAREVIGYLNGEIKKPPINERRIRKYAKDIIDSGNHYIYSETDIPGIDLGEVQRYIQSKELFRLE